MNKYLTEGLEKFLKNQEDKKVEKKPTKKLKESLEADEEKKIYKALKVAQAYIDASEDIPTFEEFKNLLQEDPQSIINYLETPCEDWEEYEVPESVVVNALNSADKIQADNPEIKFERSKYITDPRKNLDEGCKKELKEETNMDKINKYLVSIGEAPITEAMGDFDKVMAVIDGKPVSASNKGSNYDKVMKRVKDLNSTPSNYDKVKKVIDDKKSTPSNFDKIRNVLDDKQPSSSNYDKITKVLGESKKLVKRSTSLMESLNDGFAKIYGDFDDTKSLNETCKKEKKPLKEYKDMGQDLGEYQKWVDYDMKKYHKISDKTMSEIKKAGLSVVKDQYGQYEVTAKETDKDSKKKK